MSDQDKQQGYEEGYAGHVDSDFLDNLTQKTIAIKQQTYAMMHISKGHIVLDVGCGPASDTIALSELVGSTGRVIGIDHDPEMVADANQRANQAGVADFVEHRQGNGLKLPFDDNTFNSCRSERVFQHVAEADQLLAEMIRVTKPGGSIVVLDGDYSTIGTSTQYNDMDMRLRDTLCQTIKNPYVGRKLYTMMALAGLQEVEANPQPFTFSDYTVWKSLLLDIAIPQGLELGIWTQAEIDQYHSDLQQLHEQSAFYAHATYILSSGRKPT